MKIVDVSGMRAIEQKCFDQGISASELMDRAGFGVANRVHSILEEFRTKPKSIFILAGPGNNGGDGLVAASYLSDYRYDITIYLPFGSKEHVSKIDDLIDKGVNILYPEDDINDTELFALLSGIDVVVDAILGTGKSRKLDDSLLRILDIVNEAKRISPTLIVVSVDIPTGINPDTGELDESSILSDFTLTLGFPKFGLFNAPGIASVGILEVIDIGIPGVIAEDRNEELITVDSVKSLLPKRPLDSHKGTYGKVLVVAGSERYIGAAKLACESALRVGAGLVTLAIPRNLQPSISTSLTEITYLPLPDDSDEFITDAPDLILDELPRYDAVLIGCGLGQSFAVQQLLKQTLFSNRFPEIQTILDADALNIMAESPEWWTYVNNNTIVTPHPGEMSRLTGLEVTHINGNRLNVARENSKKWSKTVILKGPYSVISSVDGPVRVSPFINPVLASAGTGDVLAGMVAGFVAQGLSNFDAASLGVFVHGSAGKWLRENVGDTGVHASDLLLELPYEISRLKEALI